MFEANLNKKIIDDKFGVFLNMTIDILDDVNDTQYYLPGMTFILVLYVYFIIGEGKVWKYLLGATLSGFLGSFLTAIFNTSKIYFTLDYVLQIKWLEAILWHLNEYGYVYITFLKLKIVVHELQKKYWDYIMYTIFTYNLIIRLIIAAVTIAGRKSSAGSHLLGFSLFPLSLVELVFMFLIIKTFIEQSNGSDIQKGIVYTMLTSSLTRMFLVGLIYFLSSCVCYFYAPAILKSIKAVVWRAKASLGLIFLMDLLFIRIDIREKIGISTDKTKSYKKLDETDSSYYYSTMKSIEKCTDSSNYTLYSNSNTLRRINESNGSTLSNGNGSNTFLNINASINSNQYFLNIK